MRGSLLGSVLLAGCIPAFSGAPAGPDAMQCAEGVVGGLGYAVTSHSSATGGGSFTARKTVPPETVYPVVGEISVAVWGAGSGRRRIRVSSARYELEEGAGAPAAIPTTRPPGRPGEPGLAAAPDRPRRAGRRRLPPGPVASDAQLVLQRCGRGDRDGADGVRIVGSAGGRPT